MAVIYSGKNTAKATPDWAWKILSEPFYFACWYGATPETTWQEGSSIKISIGPKMTQFDEVGTVTHFAAGKSIGFRIFSPCFLLPDAPENYFEILIELSSLKDKVGINLTVQTEVQNITVIESARKNWKRILSSIKKTMEDTYLYAQAHP